MTSLNIPIANARMPSAQKLRDGLAALGVEHAEEVRWGLEALMAGHAPATGLTELASPDLLSGLVPCRQAIAIKSRNTADHMDAVGFMTGLVAVRIGVPCIEAASMAISAQYHDIGKLLVPDEVLEKPGRLTEAEWDVMRRHAVQGWEMCRSSDHPALCMVAAMARWHHETFDGRGYPDGLAGEAIPLEVRIVSACDVLCALIMNRPYKAGMEVGEALGIMHADAGRTCRRHFDPRVLEALVEELTEGGRLAAPDGPIGTA